MDSVYACQDFQGNWFLADETLAAALERESVRGPVNVPVALRVETEQTPGLRWARRGPFRLLAYAAGGWCEQYHVAGVGWCLFPEGEGIPPDELRPLLAALELAE